MRDTQHFLDNPSDLASSSLDFRNGENLKILSTENIVTVSHDKEYYLSQSRDTKSLFSRFWNYQTSKQNQIFI